MLRLSKSCKATGSLRKYRLLHRHLSSQNIQRNTGSKVPSTPARTRFAPSPTGYLHLGSLRTALFNYLLAKKTGGQFLLRVEDTDQSRTVPDAEAKLYRDLRWAGLEWDEGPDIGGASGPYKQSQRTELYRQHSHKLIQSGNAYRCFCSAARLNELAKRRQELGLPTDYDRTCADIAVDESNERAAKFEPHVVRLRAPERYPELDDLVYGKVGKNKDTSHAGIVRKYGEIAYEDPILLKADGHPTYHLANVVDDHHMGITHVVRATEWISSTPKHLALYEAFGWDPPAFAHVGLLVDGQGSKLSKRNHAVNVGAYMEMGVLPEALLNFVALLGWSHGQKSDVMDLAKLVEQFQMKLTKGNATISFEKLWYLQKHHVSMAIQQNSERVDEIIGSILEHAQKRFPAEELSAILGARPLRKYVKSILEADSKMYSLAPDFLERNKFFFERPSAVEIANRNVLSTCMTTSNPQFSAVEFMESLSPKDWNLETLPGKITTYIKQVAHYASSVKSDVMIQNFGQTEQDTGEAAMLKNWNKIIHTDLRTVLMAARQGPNLASTMAILGREETLWRLRRYSNSANVCA